MFVVVGRFKFKPASQEERQRMIQDVDRDFSPVARASPGFHGLQFVQLSDDELMTVWEWESAADWEAAQPRFGPYLQQYVIPQLAQPPDRVGGQVVIQAAP